MECLSAVFERTHFLDFFSGVFLNGAFKCIFYVDAGFGSRMKQ